MRPAVRTELREVHAPRPYPRVAYPLFAQFARERGRRHKHRPSPRMETAQHRPEAASRKTGTQRHILGKSGENGGGERAPVAAATAPRRPAQRPLGPDMDVFGLAIVDTPTPSFLRQSKQQ